MGFFLIGKVLRYIFRSSIYINCLYNQHQGNTKLIPWQYLLNSILVTFCI